MVALAPSSGQGRHELTHMFSEYQFEKTQYFDIASPA
jgi:hypothetical protein